MNSLAQAYYALRYLGLSFAGRRLVLAVQRGLGVTRRAFAPRPWPSIRLDDILSPGSPTSLPEYVAYKKAHPPTFLFPLGKPPSMAGPAAPMAFEREPPLSARLELLAQDRCVYFFHAPSPEPIDWYHNPFDDKRGERQRIWCDIPDFLPSQGDARVLWEPSRAAWALDCARARARGLDWPAAAQYWRWVESWMEACGPFQGFQWKCGQESAVRLIAIAMAFWALADDSHTTDERWLRFVRLAWATGYRIARHIGYAVSQNNNHAISEACGLMLVGHLFPEFAESRAWMDLGRRTFTKAIVRQIYPDGSYIQHSMNYHRLMLHGSVLAMRLAERGNQPFEQGIYDCVERASEFLYQMTDSISGRAPHYGNDDGACVLPLTECDLHDFRPILQSSHFLVHRKRLFPEGPWDEEMRWLFGDEAAGLSNCPAHTWGAASFDAGGYYKLVRDSSWAMIRCHDYRDRPGQCDPLHVDLWWKGTNVLRDCGTVQYYSPANPELARYFATRAAHNTAVIDDADPSNWVTRFLFVPFPRALCTRFDQGTCVFEGRQGDYDRPPWHVLHRRAVLALDETVWLVVDDFLGRGIHSLDLRWHLADDPWQVDPAGGGVTLGTAHGPMTLSVSSASDLPVNMVVRRDQRQHPIAGVAAPYYSSCVAIPTVVARMDASLPERVVTVVSLGGSARARREHVEGGVESWRIESNGAVWQVHLGSAQRGDTAVYLGCRHSLRGVLQHVDAP